MHFTRSAVLERWHVTGLVAGLCFAILLAIARLQPHASLWSLDLYINKLLVSHISYHWTQFFLSITSIGNPTGIATVALGSMFFLRNRYRAVLQLFLVLVLTTNVVSLAKSFVERSRPLPITWITPINSYSFPSWHAALTTALYGFILIILYRRSRTNVQAFFSIVIPSSVIVAVAFSRMALSVHYFTDVVGGILLGIFCLTLVFVIPHQHIQRRT